MNNQCKECGATSNLEYNAGICYLCGHDNENDERTIIGYKVEYAWWKYPLDKLAIDKKYAKTYEQAEKIFKDILSRHYYCARIIPIHKN
ncbi:hypothetical protein [Bacillus toyonensis]|uniref:hypothetical protein n=1 Tax=Bacillus toyonensis TaxID=155322 RepID=UPI0036D03502